jgi:hypothetical protein
MLKPIRTLIEAPVKAFITHLGCVRRVMHRLPGGSYISRFTAKVYHTLDELKHVHWTSIRRSMAYPRNTCLEYSEAG